MVYTIKHHITAINYIIIIHGDFGKSVQRLHMDYINVPNK